MQKTVNILVVDDEPAIRDMIASALDIAGFRCSTAENAATALAMIVDAKPDLVLLDWMMPGMSGIELARRLRRDEITSSIPVLMLTAKSDEDNKIQGLESGADDYLTKPFSTRELIARIKAILRRTNTDQTGQIMRLRELQLDPASKRVTISGQPVALGPTEYKLLEFFITHPERAYTRSQLLDNVWGGNVYIDERTVDVHIRRLRKALETDDHDRLVQTVRGTGYRFSDK